MGSKFGEVAGARSCRASSAIARTLASALSE